jgi:CHASE3 domain sensor protein
MAINTAAAFLILAGGVLLWSWLPVRRENLNFVRWLPATASVTLMVMITFVSAVNGVELEKATFRLKRTVKVILAAQSFEKKLIELQRAGLGLTTAGEADGFDSRQSGRNLEPEQLNRLVELTSENPRQQQRLKDLSAAMKGVFGYDWRATSLKRPPGSVAGPGRVGLDNVGAAIDRARAILKAFSLEEQGLLDRSDISEQSHVQSAARLLIFGSVVAATLLVGANFMVGREINRRQRVELEREKLIGELRQLLDEVKILSGMIPICGWCKSIRSDEGYWQSVEQYVRAHTDATFTHGICPSCAEKLKAELRQADPAGVG